MVTVMEEVVTTTIMVITTDGEFHPLSLLMSSGISKLVFEKPISQKWI
jgi:hypothetical protein